MLSQLLSDMVAIDPGRKAPGDPFFAASDAICGPYKLLGVVDTDIENEISEFPCAVQGCTEKLGSLLDLEQHYNTFHRFECRECKKHLASAHLLDLHLCEAHDSFFGLQAQRKPMFSCFVVECPNKSWDSVQRLSHCVEVHNFPANFRFAEAPRRKGGGNSSMEVDSPLPPQQTKKKKKKKSGVCAQEGAAPPALPVLGGGGRRGRGRFVPSWHQRLSTPQPADPNSPSVIDMQELEDALPPS